MQIIQLKDLGGLSTVVRFVAKRQNYIGQCKYLRTQVYISSFYYHTMKQNFNQIFCGIMQNSSCLLHQLLFLSVTTHFQFFFHCVFTPVLDIGCFGWDKMYYLSKDMKSLGATLRSAQDDCELLKGLGLDVQCTWGT